MVRALSQELSIERHTAVLDARGTNSNEFLVSKLESIEAALELRLQEMSQSWSVLSKRLQDLEASVRETAGSGESGPTIDDIRQAIDLKPISNRLDIIEEAVLGGELRGNADLGDRFAKLEGEVTRALSSSTGDDRMETLLSGIDRVDGLSAQARCASHRGQSGKLRSRRAPFGSRKRHSRRDRNGHRQASGLRQRPLGTSRGFAEAQPEPAHARRLHGPVADGLRQPTLQTF